MRPASSRPSARAERPPHPELPPAERELIRNVGWMISLRWLAGGGVLAATFAASLLQLGLPVWPIALTGVGILLYNLALHLALSLVGTRPSGSVFAYEWFARVQIGLDWLAMAVLIGLSGGIESPAIVFFLFHITIASLLLPSRRGFLYVALAPMLVGGVAVLDYHRMLPHVPLFEPPRNQDPVYVGSVLFFFTCTCYLMAYFSMSIVIRVRRREREISGLYESVRDTTSSLELQEVLQRLTTACARVLGCRAAAIQLLDRDRGRLDMLVSHGLSQAYIDKGPIEVGRAPIDQEVLSGRTVWVREVSRDSRVQYPEQARAEGIGTMLSAPLIGKTGPIGVLRAYGGEGYRFTERDAAFLAALGSHGAVAIENAKAYEALRDLDRRKARFLRTVAHELRSPVDVARTILSVLSQGYVGQLDPRLAEVVGRAQRMMDLLQRLVSDLLDLASVKAHLAADLERRAVAIGSVAREVCARYEVAAREKHVGLSCRVQGDPLIVWAYAGEMDLMVDNLVSNAVTYTPQGEVLVSVDREGEFARLVVADSGIGIPEEARPKLFEEFYRAGNAKAIEEIGTGLGLAIVKDLIERYSGRIEVDSAEGQGTTITVWLLLARRVVLRGRSGEPTST